MTPTGWGPSRVPSGGWSWPKPLLRHLDGRARITVRDSASPVVLLDREVSLGSGEGRIEVRNAQGVELGIDKSGKLVPTFAGRSDRDITALLDATESVVGALQEAGIEPFLAYGTLLGAVREGQVLGHDSDADLGYVSRFSTPVDVARESFRVQRTLAEHGWDTTRYSGSAFKVLVSPEPGVTIGLDVFGGFLDAGRLYLMGEIGTDFERDWIHPLGSCDLGGRPMPVPARPGEAARGDVRPRVAGARPGLQVHARRRAPCGRSRTGSAAPSPGSGTGSGARATGRRGASGTPRRWRGRRRWPPPSAARRCSTSAPAVAPTASGWPSRGFR